jgi:hypothetical protein
MMQQNKFDMPAIMKQMYQAPQTPMTPEQQAYWKLNTQNGQEANASINRMPFVLDPAMLFGQSREQNMATMYQPKPAAEGDAAAQPAAPQDPQAQMLALLQSNPELLPLIMQQMGGQNQQVVVPSNQGP